MLRELHELKKKYPKKQELKRFSLRIKRFFERGKQLQVEYEEKKDISSKLKRLITDTDTLISKDYKSPDIRRLCKRLFKYRNEMYTFIQNATTADNNNAEREIRPSVLLRKISYCNRSDQGAHNQEIMMSMVRTSAKQNMSFVNMATEYLGTH